MYHGPVNPLCQQTHAEKYRGENESFHEAAERWTRALSDDEVHRSHLLDIGGNMRFCPGGRVQAAIGSGRQITAYNCFVSGTIADSFVDDEGSIMQRATEAATTQRLGGGIGYDFSTLRPRGDAIKKIGSRSSGPLSFMGIFDSVCKCVASAGHRRGAQMGILRVDHPSIWEFVQAKQNTDNLTGFNISIAVTDLFMECLRDGRDFPLHFEGKVYERINPAELWEQIMQATWDWAEPGVVFIDRINDYNNLQYMEYIAATNPCGEQPLPPYGACLLGSFNLVKYLRVTSGGHFQFDYDQFEADIPAVVRAMDNVVDRTIYPLPQQEEEAKLKRRMGLGIMGAANAIEACIGRACYGEPVFVSMLDEILRRLKIGAYTASVELAKEKGSFPGFDRDKYLNSRFIQEQLPDYLKSLISKHGIRNSHLLSIAPTGTISFCSDNVSSAIEPVFAYSQDRDLITPKGRETVTVKDYGYAHLGVSGKKSSQVTIDEHLAVLACATRQVDSAVSKTCNVSPDMPWEEFKSVYYQAWERGCKGITTFNSGGKRFGILRESEKVQEEPVKACKIDPATGRRECE